MHPPQSPPQLHPSIRRDMAHAVEHAVPLASHLCGTVRLASGCAGAQRWPAAHSPSSLFSPSYPGIWPIRQLPPCAISSSYRLESFPLTSFFPLPYSLLPARHVSFLLDTSQPSLQPVSQILPVNRRHHRPSLLSPRHRPRPALAEKRTCAQSPGISSLPVSSRSASSKQRRSDWISSSASSRACRAPEGAPRLSLICFQC